MNDKKIDIKNKLDDGLTFKISRFKEQIKKTNPHKHEEYYELIFLSEGEGFHNIESEKFMISAPEFYFLKPRQLHYWQFTSIPKGFVILFKDTEFDAIKENTLIELYKKIFDTTRIKFNSQKYPIALLNELYNEFQNKTNFSTEIMHGLLIALFGKLLQTTESINQTGQSLSIYDKFQTLLIKECPLLHKVNEFANLLNITPQNLNAVCRKQTGKSASDIITRQILIEAKRYILHTNNTINEIADILSFSDSSNFVKFFKKHEKITPAHFRSKYFQ
jgi:AraC family transcriptional regulator, transcriptional activator of pobA